MMALSIFLSVGIICFTVSVFWSDYFDFKNAERKQVDTIKLSELLEAELKSMKELKVRMEQLLLRNGLGR